MSRQLPRNLAGNCNREALGRWLRLSRIGKRQEKRYTDRCVTDFCADVQIPRFREMFRCWKSGGGGLPAPSGGKENVMLEDAGRETGEMRLRKKNADLYEWVQALVCSVLTVVLLFTFVIRLIGVDGDSMVPTLRNGDRLLVLNSLFCGDYQQGDIVIVRKASFFQGSPIVKRVIATGGQTVDIDFLSGSVYVDGELLAEDYINEPTYTPEGVEFPLRVEDGCIFVMGDNRNHSSDSRNDQLGAVDVRCVIGKAVFRIFPGPDETGQRHLSRIGVIS